MEVTDFDTEKKIVNVTIINACLKEPINPPPFHLFQFLLHSFLSLPFFPFDIKKKISFFYIFIVFIILKKKQWHVRKLNFPKEQRKKYKHWKRFYDKTKRIIEIEKL